MGDCQGTLSVLELLEDRKLKILEYNVPLEASLSEYCPLPEQQPCPAWMLIQPTLMVLLTKNECWFGCHWAGSL